MANDEEPDYMSDTFLSKALENDIRPGLTVSYSMKRKHELEKKKIIGNETNKKKRKPRHEIEKEKLQEGLSKPLDVSNKGFMMLEKMGFKAGMSLGKHGDGITEPVSVSVKSDKIGLGWRQMLIEKKKCYDERRKRKQEIDPMAFRCQMSNIYNKKKIEIDLHKCRKICCELDNQKNIEIPEEYWFWPKYTWNSYENESEDGENIENLNEYINLEEDKYEDYSYDELEPQEQLQVINSYLRSTYFYCIWCSVSYEDIQDIETNCPGITRSDHE